MENQTTIKALTAKRAELLKSLEQHQAAAREAFINIEHLDAALRLMGVESITPKGLMPKYRRETARIVLSALRNNGKPMTAADLAKIVLIERKVNPDDTKLVQAVAKRVRGSLQHYRRQGMLTAKENQAGLLEWAISA